MTIHSSTSLRDSSTERMPSSFVPSNSLLKLDTASTEDVQSATNGQIHFAAAQLLHKLQVLKVTAAASICNRNCADGRKKLYKFDVNASLLAFYVCGVNQKLGAVRFEEGDVFCWSLARRLQIWCRKRLGCSPFVIGKSVMVCHRSMATRHPPSTRRQLRSMTSFLVSPPSAASTACSRSSAKVPEGNRKEVMMTYRKERDFSAT